MKHAWTKPKPAFEGNDPDMNVSKCLTCGCERYDSEELGLIGCWRNGQYYSNVIPGCIDIEIENLKTID